MSKQDERRWYVSASRDDYEVVRVAAFNARVSVSRWCRDAALAAAREALANGPDRVATAKGEAAHV